MLHKSGVTESLARFIVATRWEDIPAPVRHQAKRSLLNFFAVALAGCRTAPVETALRSLAQFSGGTQAAVVGRAERIDALSAAFLNAAGANVHDFCDTHLRTVIHPTAPVAPAVLALAEMRRLSGPDLQLGFHPRQRNTGPHRACDLAQPLRQGMAHHLHLRRVRRRRRGRQTGGARRAPDGVGARQRGHAIGGAVRMPGHGGKKLRASATPRATDCGRRCWRSKDLTGRPSRSPACRAFTTRWRETPDLSLVTDGLGESWEIMATSYKPYPCGFVIHPVLDCVLDWRRDHPAAEVTRIVVRGNPLLAARTDRPDISTGRESQVSVQHAVAAALVTGKAGIDQFTDACVRDPRVLALRKQIEVDPRRGVFHHCGGGRDHHRRWQGP